MQFVDKYFQCHSFILNLAGTPTRHKPARVHIRCNIRRETPPPPLVTRSPGAQSLEVVRLQPTLCHLWGDRKFRLKQPHGTVPQGTHEGRRHPTFLRGAGRQLSERTDGVRDCVDTRVCDMDGLYETTLAGACLHELCAYSVECIDSGVEDAGRGEVLRVLYVSSTLCVQSRLVYSC